MTLIVCHLHDVVDVGKTIMTPETDTGTFVDDWQTLQSSMESTGDDDLAPVTIPLDANGHILPYVSFDSYYQHTDRERVEAAIAAIVERYRTRELPEEDEVNALADD